MNWDDLRIFDAAASNGSLSAGAKALGLSQPQMSRRLRDLEHRIGARLFDRTPQGLRPTGAGAKLIPLAENMRRAADKVVRATPDLATSATTTVRIAVDEIREHFLISNLSLLRRALSDVTLEIFSDHEHPDHEARTTDVQIRSCLPDSETLIAKRIGQTGYGLYACRTLVDEHKSARDEPDFAAAPYIDFSPDQLWYPVQKRWLEEYFSGVSNLRVNTMTGMFNAACAGQGLALLPHFMARDHSQLIQLESRALLPVTVEYLIVHRDLLREKIVRRVVDEITQLYRANRAALIGS